MNKAFENLMEKNKIRKSLYANEKPLAEFYIALTSAIHF